MKKQLLAMAIGILLGLTSMYYLRGKEYVDVEVPIKIEVPVPVVKKVFDTIYMPKYINGPTTIDSTYYEKYTILKDSTSKDSLFKEAIVLKEYKYTVEDDTITINIYNKVRGKLLSHKVDYKTKPYKFILDTIITVPIPKRGQFYGGISVFLTKNTNINGMSPSIYPELIYLNKNNKWLFKGGYDIINKGVTVGVYRKF